MSSFLARQRLEDEHDKRSSLRSSHTQDNDDDEIDESLAQHAAKFSSAGTKARGKGKMQAMEVDEDFLKMMEEKRVYH